MLRERVMDELKITKEADITELTHEAFDQQKLMMKVDVEAKYNLNHLDSSFGYDNLAARADTDSKLGQAEAAHQTAVDKLLAHYFQGKKNEVKEANKLIYDLADIFDDDVLGRNSFDTLLHKQRLQSMGKEDSRTFHFEAFKDMMDLDVITSRHLQRNKNGLSNELR